MTTQTWIQIAVIFGVLLYTQVGTKRLNGIRILMPIGLALYFGSKYISSLSTSGNNMLVLLLCAVLGAVFGGMLVAVTRVSRDASQRLYTQAGAPYALILIVSLGIRLGSAYYAEHDPQTVGKFFYHYQISPDIIGTAFIVMMMVMLVVRLSGVLFKVNQLKKNQYQVTPNN